MTRKNTISMAAVAIALSLAMGCGSGMGGLGGVLGGDQGNSYPSSNSQMSSVQGAVRSIDTRNQRIDMDVYSVDGRSSNSGTTTIYYDSRTRVSYQNQGGSVANLERGDRIDVQLLDRGNGQYVADSITVTQSASNNSGNYPSNSGNYPNNSGNYPNSTQNGQSRVIQGTVNSIDTRAQRIDLNVTYMNGLRNSQSGSYIILYDSRTQVLYQGQSHSPSDLERGDQVEVRAYDNGNGQYMADTITVTRNVRG